MVKKKRMQMHLAFGAIALLASVSLYSLSVRQSFTAVMVGTMVIFAFFMVVAARAFRNESVDSYDTAFDIISYATTSYGAFLLFCVWAASGQSITLALLLVIPGVACIVGIYSTGFVDPVAEVMAGLFDAWQSDVDEDDFDFTSGDTKYPLDFTGGFVNGYTDGYKDATKGEEMPDTSLLMEMGQTALEIKEKEEEEEEGEKATQ